MIGEALKMGLIPVFSRFLGAGVAALVALASLASTGSAAPGELPGKLIWTTPNAPSGRTAETASPFAVRDDAGRELDFSLLAGQATEDVPLGPGPSLDQLDPVHPRMALRSLFPPMATAALERRRGLFQRLFGLRKPQRYEPLQTRYPVVLLHGANVPKVMRFGRIKLRYFSKTEAHLRRLNLRLLVPSVNPFGSIEERAADLVQQIQAAIPEGKFNLVCHSMGGLDARYLASRSVLKDRIASVTTVSTPHRGAWYADFADEWVFKKQGLYKLLGLLGMHMDQMHDLTVRYMEEEFNPETPDNPNVAYYSYGTWTHALLSPPFYWGMNFITGVSERRALARGRGVTPSYGPRTPIGLRGKRGEILLSDLGVRTLERGSDRGGHDWIVPKWAGRNDGVVSLSSSVWGTYMGTVKAHHWGPMGWLSTMKEYRFWEEVIRKLEAQGF